MCFLEKISNKICNDNNKSPQLKLQEELNDVITEHLIQINYALHALSTKNENAMRIALDDLRKLSVKKEVKNG